MRQICNSLEEVRTEIDSIDSQLIKLISDRSFYVDQAAKYKKSKSEVEAPARVEFIINKVRALAKKENLNADIAEKIYRTMISAFIEQEKQRIN